jgi:hypothetical protein
MGKPSVAPAERTLFDLELVIASGDDVVNGYDLAGLLRLGGPKPLASRLAGLIDMLEPHEELNGDQLAFVKGSLTDLLQALWTFDADAGHFAKLWRVQPRKTDSEAVA